MRCTTVEALLLSVARTVSVAIDPTKGVDIHSRREIHEILRQCTESGMTVVISASDSEELLEVSDRVYVFYEGRVSAMLAGASKTPERLVAAMMGMNSQKEEKAV